MDRGIEMACLGEVGARSFGSLMRFAAEHDGLYAMHLDQTGLAQRGGKVVSHCILSRAEPQGSPRIEPGRADVLLAFDPLGSSDREALRALDPARTRAVVHELYVPTGADVAAPGFVPPELSELIEPLRGATRSLEGVPVLFVSQHDLV